jgi:hypothetical protein
MIHRKPQPAIQAGGRFWAPLRAQSSDKGHQMAAANFIEKAFSIYDSKGQ